MATQTLIQYLESEQFSAFPGGAATPIGLDSMNRRQEETFLAGATVAVGDAVSLDLSAANAGLRAITVVSANDGAAATNIPVGVVLGSAESDGALTAGSKIRVCVRGLCGAKVVASAAGDVLTTSAVNGQAVTTAAATEPRFAQALEAAVALPGLTGVYVSGRF